MLAQWFARRPAPPIDLRDAMLAELAACDSLEIGRLRLRIRTCRDTQALWHLRAPLMQALSVVQGEVDAREHIVRIDSLFRSAWPDAPVSRPAPLR